MWQAEGPCCAPHRREDEGRQASIVPVRPHDIQNDLPLRGAATSLARAATTIQRVVNALGTADARASVTPAAPSRRRGALVSRPTRRVCAACACIATVVCGFFEAVTAPGAASLLRPGAARRGSPHPLQPSSCFPPPAPLYNKTIEQRRAARLAQPSLLPRRHAASAASIHGPIAAASPSVVSAPHRRPVAVLRQRRAGCPQQSQAFHRSTSINRSTKLRSLPCTRGARGPATTF